MAFPFSYQKDSMQCGITCLQMICEYYGKRYSLSFLEKLEIDNIDEIVEKLEKFYEANSYVFFIQDMLCDHRGCLPERNRRGCRKFGYKNNRGKY